jgi:WhiB family redox-sensing transcriptional regulator
VTKITTRTAHAARQGRRVEGEIIVRELYLLEGEVDESGWQERALCAQTDPEAFFPEKGGSTREAKRVCLTCDVRGECLEYALENDERFGIWGGMSERERRKLKKRAV